MRRHLETQGGVGGREKKLRAAAEPLNKLEGISARTFLDLDPQEARWGRDGNLPGTRWGPGHRVSPSCDTGSRRRQALRGQRRRPPSNSRKGGPGQRGTQWAREDRPGPGRRKGKRNRERAEGEGGCGGPAAGRAGERIGPRNAASPPQTQQRLNGNPGRARQGWLGRKEVAGSLLRAAGRRHHWGEGVPRPLHAGQSPLPAAAHGRPRRPRQPCGPGPALAPAEAAAPALESPGRREEGGDAAEGKVGFRYVSFYRVGGAPVRAGARVAGRAGSRGPGPAGQALRSQGPSPRRGRSLAARPLLPPPARPLAPGAWIDLVVLASGSRSRPASTPRLPIPCALARPPAPLLTRAPARRRRRRRRATRDPLQIPRPACESAAQRSGARGPRGERPRPPVFGPIDSKEENNSARPDFPPLPPFVRVSGLGELSQVKFSILC